MKERNNAKVVAASLSSAFCWDMTEEGYEFWEKISEKLDRISENYPEIPKKSEKCCEILENSENSSEIPEICQENSEKIEKLERKIKKLSKKLDKTYGLCESFENSFFSLQCQCDYLEEQVDTLAEEIF